MSENDSKLLSEELADKHRALRENIRSMGRVVVAFSGGIDSSLVAHVAATELGENALIATSGSASLKRSDLSLTQHLADRWKLNHRVITTDELSNNEYRANPTNRCFYCKTSLYTALQEIAETEHYDYILNGTNIDDLGDHRPGLQAASDFLVLPDRAHEMAVLLDEHRNSRATAAGLTATLGRPDLDIDPERNPEELGEVTHYAEDKDYRDHWTCLA